MWATRKHSGFTIVELLIVVVVIGILAAIVIVAYNGITTQAKNTKTISAVNTWVKALRLYEVDKGGLPNTNSCLGTTSTYSGDGYCWDGTSWDVKTSFLNMMDPYISSYPEPDTTSIHETQPRRGAFYQYLSSNGKHYIRVMLAGTSECPSLNAGPLDNSSVNANGIWCSYALD
jgi:prepilin-type N-terminal cleavage/methylation domain-containing protein|tara:strand:- start:209 stop:730 length:522 start_codon:yes stop_codon:yes gene_type:complete